MIERRVLLTVSRVEGFPLISERLFSNSTKRVGAAIRTCLSASTTRTSNPLHLRSSLFRVPSRHFSCSDKTSSFQESIFVRMWNAYSQSLARRPLTTKATAAATIFFTSDSAAQYLTRQEGSEFSYNMSRALSGSFFGVVATGYMHVWWNFLERALGARLPLQTHRLTNTIVKVFVDQAFGAPFYIYSYYLVTNFLQQMSHNTEPDTKTPQQVLQKTHDKASEMLWPTMLKHWRLWPLVHSINFYFVPLHHRVLVQNLVLVFWSGYLSHLNHNSAKLLTPKEEIEETAKEMVRRRTASSDASSNKVDASAGAKTK